MTERAYSTVVWAVETRTLDTVAEPQEEELQVLEHGRTDKVTEDIELVDNLADMHAVDIHLPLEDNFEDFVGKILVAVVL